MSAIRIAGKPAKSGLIFVHGLGDSGEGWSWFPQLIKQANIIHNSETINYVFPNAPLAPVTANGGMRMPSWFDIYEFNNPRAKSDVAGFLKSVEALQGFIKEQISQGVPAERIILGGFSQGAAVSLATAALLDVKIGGVVALLGFCPIADTVREKYTGVNATTPVFQGHGNVDPIILHEWAVAAKDLYKGLGFKNYQFETYNGLAHSASEEELGDVMEFIGKILN